MYRIWAAVSGTGTFFVLFLKMVHRHLFCVGVGGGLEVGTAAARAGPSHFQHVAAQPGPAHDIGSEAHETRALYGPARRFCGQAREFDGPFHGRISVPHPFLTCTLEGNGLEKDDHGNGTLMLTMVMMVFPGASGMLMLTMVVMF